MTNRETILDRIRKLRALSADPNNLNEATTAAKIAEELLQKHQIAEAELILEEGEKEEPKLDDNPVETFGQRQNVWKNILSLQLAKAYNCTTVWQRKGGVLGLYVIGRPSDIEIVKYNYAYLSLQIVRLAELNQPSGLYKGAAKGWRNSFYLGATNAIISALEEEKEKVRAESNSSALAVVDKHMAESNALASKLFPNARESSFNSNINRDAYNKGFEAGQGLQSKPSLPAGNKLLNK